MTTLNFVNVNPSDLSKAKRVKITASAEKAVEKIISNSDLNLSSETRNTLKMMILLSRNKNEKIKLTALRVAVKFLSKLGYSKSEIFMKISKKNCNSSVVFDVLQSDIADVLNGIINEYSVVKDNISVNYFKNVSYYTILAEFLKGKLHKCKTCGKWTPVTYCSVECVHYDDLSDLNDTSITEEEFKKNHGIL